MLSTLRIKYLAAALGVFGVGALQVLIATVPSAPSNFYGPTIVEVSEGEGLAAIANDLENAGVIHSAFWFRAITIAREGETSIQAGAYRFNEPIPEYEAVSRLMEGDYGVLEYRVTIPEGFTATEIAARLSALTEKTVFDDSVEQFIASEGKLFPETYFFDELTTPESAIEAMLAEFSERSQEAGLRPAEVYEFNGRTYDAQEVLIMASIIEGEANTPESRRMIADILWRRLSIDKPLQVDATLAYVTGRGSAELTKEDLKAEHDFNTYTNRGLPPAPINNPGEDAIQAALNPTPNKYLYFLTGDDGEMYYATTFDVHLKNQREHIESID
jgi:UPF0755 protein